VENEGEKCSYERGGGTNRYTRESFRGPSGKQDKKKYCRKKENKTGFEKKKKKEKKSEKGIVRKGFFFLVAGKKVTKANCSGR